MENEIRCPKCSSNQITADKKGFSGGKALAGAVLTGGIGLLAGTIGSKDIVITCLACGHQFKPGQGKTTTIHKAPYAGISFSEELSGGDLEMLRIAKESGKLAAIKYIKAIRNFDLATAETYVTTIATKHMVQFGQPKPQKGCAAIILLPIGIFIGMLLHHLF